MSADLRLCDLRTKSGKRIAFEMFAHAPLGSLFLGRAQGQKVIIDVVVATQLRDALDEFINQIEEEGGDPLLKEG